MSTFVYVVASKRHLKHSGAFLVISMYIYRKGSYFKEFYHGSNTREIVYRFPNL